VIVWLSGAFGVGKSTAATAMAGMAGMAGTVAIFDPEEVGPLVTHVRPSATGDFQDVPAWRRLVVAACAELSEHAGGPLLVPMTLLRKGYAEEIFSGIHALGLPLAHAVLHCQQTALIERIDGDLEDSPAVCEARRLWRHAHRDAYYAATPWLHRLGAPLVIDTTDLRPAEVARAVARWAGLPLDETNPLRHTRTESRI